MGAPAIVLNDKIVGNCPNHVVPGPAGAATPVPPPGPPFSAPLTQGLATKVMIGSKPAATMGSSGFNTPPHPGLDPRDPFFTLVPSPKQGGRVTTGSATVFIEGEPAATLQSQATCCVAPGKLVPSVKTVLIG
jgi:uncharacterized Zn-binding protein involved in type VI secretion